MSPSDDWIVFFNVWKELNFCGSPPPLFLSLQILVVIEPLLIDEDYYARVEGREIISNLAKVIIL